MSLLLVLPIALPGIVTGLALQSAFNLVGVSVLDLHHRDRPRDVLHRRRLQQRHRAPRRTSTSLMEASADLGASPLRRFAW